jgi:hypothetical protein
MIISTKKDCNTVAALTGLNFFKNIHPTIPSYNEKGSTEKNTKAQPRVDIANMIEKEEKAHQHDENEAGHDHE